MFEQQQRRRGAHAIGQRSLLVLVELDLRDREPTCVIHRELVEQRRERLARSAPFAPEVDRHREWRLQDLSVEGGVGGVEDVIGHYLSLRDCP